MGIIALEIVSDFRLSAYVKVCGCRPHQGGAAQTRPACANLQRRNADNARNQIAADSIDAVARGHDISCTVDPGHCSGASYERAAQNRTGQRAF